MYNKQLSTFAVLLVPASLVSTTLFAADMYTDHNEKKISNVSKGEYIKPKASESSNRTTSTTATKPATDSALPVHTEQKVVNTQDRSTARSRKRELKKISRSIRPTRAY